MAHQGSNPLTAIQIALNGAAAEMIKQEKGASSYLHRKIEFDLSHGVRHCENDGRSVWTAT